jgi:subfamily B ATP-binding cassette protein HlyB/CyaB
MAEIHEVIEHLPQCYKTEIGERAAGLSGGRKATDRNCQSAPEAPPESQLRDEATSDLDPATAEHSAKTVSGLSGKGHHAVLHSRFAK